MSTETTQANAYLRTRVLTASPEELRLMLLDGAIRFAEQARDGLVEKNYEKSYSGFSQCRAILIELMTTMRAEVHPELCTKLRSLYTYMITQLLEASLEKTTDRVDEVIELLGYDRETWVMAMDQLAAERAAGAPPRPDPGDQNGRGPLSISA